MSKVKILKRLDGGVSVVYPVWKNKLESESDEEFIERTTSKLRLQPNLIGAEEFIIDSSDIPNSRENRNEWEYDEVSKKVKENQDKIKAKNDAKKKDSDDKNSAISKLNALGLTDDEIEALKK